MCILYFVQAEEKNDEKDNIISTIGNIIDIFNIFSFVLGGGPDEVYIRIFVLFIFVLIFIIISTILILCLKFIDSFNYYNIDNNNNNYNFYNRNINISTFLEWVFRSIGLYYLTDELYRNRNKWM